jgi:hypothetical protein
MIAHVLGASGRIAGPLGYTQYRASAAWWLSGGVSAVNAIAVYQPKGAADIATSYVNLANPGVYNAAPGVAPTFDAATGWTFVKTSLQYLTTGVVPATGWSMVIRFSDATTLANDQIPCGCQESATFQGMYFVPNYNASGTYVVRYRTSTSVNVAPNIAGGVVAIAGPAAYRNGNLETALGNITAVLPAVVIGAYAYGTSVTAYTSCKVQAFALYNATLTGPQVAAVSAAMALL